MKKFLLVLGLVFLQVSCAGCDQNVLNPGPGPTPTVHEGPIVQKPVVKEDASGCKAGCGKLLELGCPEGKNLVYPTVCSMDTECTARDQGKCRIGHCAETCEEICIALINQGKILGLGCWVNAKSCSDVANNCSL